MSSTFFFFVLITLIDDNHLTLLPATQVNIMAVLNDAMYSDSHTVIDSLADFVETTMQTASSTVISQGRMNQVRHIIQVDEASFKANFTAEQLKTIETKEMAAIVEEVVSAVGLQRLRFTERRNKGKREAVVHRGTVYIGLSKLHNI